MKTTFTILMVLIFVQLGFSQSMVVNKNDGGKTTFPLSDIKNITFEVSGIPTNGLVAYYPFNGNANDESGNGNNGTIYNATSSKDRKDNDNSAYKINGSGSKIVVSDNILFNSSNQITISAWANPTTTWTYNAKHIISKEVKNNYGFALGFDQNSSEYGTGNYCIFLQIVKPSGSDVIYKVLTPSELPGWKNIVFVIDGNSMKLYLNGKEVASKVVAGLQFISSGPINIGVRDLRNDQFYTGYVDDIRIYNRALTEQEIQALFNE